MPVGWAAAECLLRTSQEQHPLELYRTRSQQESLNRDLETLGEEEHTTAGKVRIPQKC